MVGELVLTGQQVGKVGFTTIGVDLKLEALKWPRREDANSE
jgi:hypothetical protein